MAGDRERYREAMRRGLAYNNRQQWKKAFQAFRVALAEFPTSPSAFAGLGEACFGLKMLDRALESYKLASRHSRGEIKYLQRVADLQERLGQLSEAARTYMAAGELQLRQRNLEAASSNWERAVRLEPGLLGAHRRLATVFQRQGNVRAAVREYLAIARTLQIRGEPQKALQMCRAALRLDPDNEDVLMAMELVREGDASAMAREAANAPAVAEPAVAREAAAPREEEDEMAQTVRQIAEVFEEERRDWQAEQVPAEADDPVTTAVRRAQNELADEIFRDEEDEDALYGARDGLSKLERDALIGQGIDFQARGQAARAIDCYERAVAGGLSLAAAHFTLGFLYLEEGESEKARKAFARAARDTSYRSAIRAALNR